MGPIEDSWALHPRGSCSITPSSNAARRPCGSQAICRCCWTAVALFFGWQVKAMKRWRLSIFPGITYSGVSCSCIGRLVPGVSQPLFLLSPLMYQRLGQLATSGKRLQQLCDIYIYILYTPWVPYSTYSSTRHSCCYCALWGGAAPSPQSGAAPSPESRLPPFSFEPKLAHL